MSGLKELRQEIDALDDELVRLLERRFACARETRRHKTATFDPSREQEILDRLQSQTSLRGPFLKALFSTIFAESRRTQNTPDTSTIVPPAGPFGIIGQGRFGSLWKRILEPYGSVLTYDRATDSPEQLDTLVGTARVVFFAVPISEFENSLREVLQRCSGTYPLFVDLLSVKLHAKELFSRLLPSGARGLLLHPLFGPDSFESALSLPIVVDRFTAEASESDAWLRLFTHLGFSVVEMTAEEHDRRAAWSQGVTHYIGRILGELKLESSEIDTAGTRLLHQITTQVCHDTWQLFSDLQTLNPFTLEMRNAVGRAQARVYSALLPDRLFRDRLVIGIQGGRGSFNEQAARYYLERNGIQDFELVYLHTSENVLKALYEGRVDRGQFATHNSVGGIVHESVEAMSRYTFQIVEEYALEIRHALMLHPEATLAEVDTVMTHPQVLRQCARNLREKYPNLKLTSGEGELVDHAKVAEQLAAGALPKNIAVMGSKVLADINGLRIVEDNLQDASHNLTSFLLVKRS